MRRGVTNLAGTVTGVFSFATSYHIGRRRLPAALRRFHEAYPEVRFDSFHGRRSRLRRADPGRTGVVRSDFAARFHSSA